MKKYIVMILLCGGMSWGTGLTQRARALASRAGSAAMKTLGFSTSEPNNFWKTEFSAMLKKNRNYSTLLQEDEELIKALAFLRTKNAKNEYRDMEAIFEFNRWVDGRKAKLIWNDSKKQWDPSDTERVVISPKAYHILGAICIIEFGERLSTEVLANETIKGLHNKNYDKKEIIGILINASTKAEQIQIRKDVIGNIVEFIQKVALEITMHQTDEARLNFVETLNAILHALPTPEAIFDFKHWDTPEKKIKDASGKEIGTLTPDLYHILAAAYLIDVYPDKNLNGIKTKVRNKAFQKIDEYEVKDQAQYKALFDKLKGQLNALQLGSADDAHGGGNLKLAGVQRSGSQLSIGSTASSLSAGSD